MRRICTPRATASRPCDTGWIPREPVPATDGWREVLQALVLLVYMCPRQSLDIAKLNRERVASVKLHWKEENGLTKIENAVAQAVFGWILKFAQSLAPTHPALPFGRLV